MLGGIQFHSHHISILMLSGVDEESLYLFYSALVYYILIVIADYFEAFSSVFKRTICVD